MYIYVVTKNGYDGRYEYEYNTHPHLHPCLKSLGNTCIYT